MEQLITVNGGSLGVTQKLQVNEEPEVPILPPSFERNYAPDAEGRPEQVELPRTVKEPKSEMQNVPGSTTVPEKAKTILEKEWEQIQRESDAQDEALMRGGII